MVQQVTSATVSPGPGWGLYDLGTFVVRASEPPGAPIEVTARLGASNAAVDLNAFIMLPDSTTWYLNPANIAPSVYGYPLGLFVTTGHAPYTNRLLLDDTLADQFICYGPSQFVAPSPAGLSASAVRISQFSRGLIRGLIRSRGCQ